MLLAALLLIGASQTASVPDALDPTPTRSGVIAGYRAVLAGHDTDGDGRLGLAEWTAMINLSFPSPPRPGETAENYAQVRALLGDLHGQWDEDGDGMLTLEELARLSLANFDCMDADRDLRLSEAEIQAGMERCRLPDDPREGDILAPPAPTRPAD